MAKQTWIVSLFCAMGLLSTAVAQDQRVSSTIPGRVDVAARDAAASSDSTATESLPQPPQNPREAWAYTTGKSIYVWAYPMVNMHNRRRAYLWANNLANIRNNRPRVLSRIISPEQHRGKVEPASPLHRVRMQSDYVQAEQRFIVCPNQDVAYGLGFSDLEDSPLVFQVPDFGERYWSFQLIDQRSDVFATPGSRLKSSTGHYLVVGPDWKGETPNGMTKVIRSPTRYICMLPRVFMDDTPEDRKIVQPLLNQVMSYPLAEYDGTIRTTDWRKKGKYRKTRRKSAISWVLPSGFWSQLADVLDEVPPLDGEEALYEQARKLVESSEADPRIAEILRMAAMDADAEIIAPLKQFRNVGDSYGNGWFGTSLGGRFDTNYFERTAVAVAYMLVNVQEDAFYLTADDDGDGESLDGSTANYQLTFPKGKLPPVEAFWSLTAYDKHHFFVKNRMKRYSVGTKTRSLQPNDDGSLTIYLQSKPPVKERMSNWLPIPADKFCVMLRCYVPDESVLDKTWQAPPIVAKGSAGE